MTQVFTVETPEIPLCDFCSLASVKWRYDAEDFETARIGNVAAQSIGHWGACATCKEMIDAGERESLAERSTMALIKNATAGRKFTPVQVETLRDLLWLRVKQVHDNFFKHKKGGPTEINS